MQLKVDNHSPQVGGAQWRYEAFAKADERIRRARAALVEARPSDDWGGRKKRVLKVCLQIQMLLKRHLTAAQDKERMQNWFNACDIEAEAARHRGLPILAFWGLAEVLHLLHQVLKLLVAENKYNEALALLVSVAMNPGFFFHSPLTTCQALQEYWTMQRMIERTVH